MAVQRHQRRVTFVADELLGYAGNGIGTTTTFVSVALARRGHDVTVLFAGPPRSGPVTPEWQSLYQDAGVLVRELGPGPGNVEPRQFARAREVEAALRVDPPDVVVVQDLGAPAYTALRLRSLGLAFERTLFVAFCHGTRRWVTDVSRKIRVQPGAHAVAVLERASVELADAVVSPSVYLADWMREEGWRLPAQSFVIPHVSRAAATGQPQPAPVEPTGHVERIAFFGRLEERKGVGLFVEAVNSLDPQVDVEFLGRPTPPWPVERIRELLTREHTAFETGLDQHEALERLRRPGTLAVIPSFEENSPNVIYECLENGIPFIASDVAGIRELVAPQDRARVLFDPTRDALVGALRLALANGDALRPARAAFDDEESLRRWEHVLALPAEPPPATQASALEPGWMVLRDDGDVAGPDLVETLVRAQQVSRADVVTCGVSANGTTHLFPGEPGALGLLANGYGTVALVRAAQVEGRESEAPWPLLAQLSLEGARIVSVPLPLATTTIAPATLETRPDEALRVLASFERALPDNLRYLAEVVTRTAAAKPVASPASQRSVPRRALGRLARMVGR
jgi:glycosyltransferase involved in cell wall biosynthesis